MQFIPPFSKLEAGGLLATLDKYEDVDPNKIYNVASYDYILQNGGCGMETYLKDTKPTHSGTVKDIETVTQYLEKLNGDFSKYSTVDSRITTI